MGNKHKKNLRKESSKVKLKTKKTVLTKAQNITDTTFKVKKIVIRDQLKPLAPNELLTRKKQNVKELLSRLRHHNVSMKKESLEGLQELVMYHSEVILDLHLAELIEGTIQLVLDEEKDIRKEALKLFGNIISQVHMSRLMPFSNMLLNYLGCGMTHIHTTIQNDSLAMLDLLLDSTPLFVAASSDKILPNLLDMISRVKTDSKSGRTLTVNLSNRFTSVKWHIKVLNRLHGLLSAIIEQRKETHKNGFEKFLSASDGTDTRNWNEGTELHIPVRNIYYGKSCHLSNFSIGSNLCNISGDNADEHLTKYASMLMPLLMNMWLEVAPGRDNNSRNTQENCSLLSQEAAQLLKFTLETIQLLFELLGSEATLLFSMYRKDFLKLFFRHFPFICSQRYEEGMKSKKKMEKYNQDSKCIEQNLAICHLFCLFCIGHHNDDSCIHMLNYVKDTVENWDVLNDKYKTLQVLRYLFLQHDRCWDHRDMNLSLLLDTVVRTYARTHDDDLFQLLCQLAIISSQMYSHRCTSFHKWVESLPSLLCSSIVSSRTVEMLAKVARQNNPFFYASLRRKLPQILDNLKNVRVIGAENENKGKQNIGNILYWVKDWSKDSIKILSRHMTEEDWDNDLTSHIIDLLKERLCK